MKSNRMIYYWGVVTAFSAGAILSGTSSFALEQEEAGASRGTLENIVVTATKRQESLQDVSVSVSAFGSEAIERINPVDSTELLQRVSGLEIQTNAGSTNANIFVRGVGSTGISFNMQSGVGVYSDEVVLNSPVVNILQVYDLERVEVLRGPQNTLYGRNTTGGAVNFISRKPEVGGEANGFISTTYGRFNQVDLTGAVGLPLGDKAAVRAAVQYQTRDGIRRNLLTGRNDEQRENFAARLQFAFEPTDRLSFNLKGHIERVRSDNIRYKTVGGFDPNDLTSDCPTPNELGACAGSDGFMDTSDPREIIADLEDAQNDVNSGGVSLHAEMDFAAFTLTSITAYEENSQVLSEDSDATPSQAFHFFLDNEQQQFSQEIRLTSAADSAFRWILGGYYFNEDLEGTIGPLFGPVDTPFLVRSNSTFDNKTWSGYGEAEYDVTEQITFKGGLRYSNDSIKGQAQAVTAPSFFFPGIDLDQSLIGGTPLPDFSTLADLAVANGVGVFNGVPGAGPRLVNIGGPNDPDAQINDTNFSQWGGMAGIDYKPTDNVLVYAKYSRGFKAGRFNVAPRPINSLDAATGRSLADTPVRPEKVTSYEIGVKSEFADNRVRLNAAGFYNDYTDQQINQFIAGEFVVLNADSKIWGAEVEVNVAPGDGLFFDVAATYLTNSVDNPNNLPDIGGKLPMAPEFSFNFAARKEWDLANGNLISLGFDGKYVGARYFDLSNISADDSYFVANAQASYAFGSERQFSILVWGKNIFKELYFVNRFTNGSLVGPDTVFLSQPAMYGVTLRAEF